MPWQASVFMHTLTHCFWRLSDEWSIFVWSAAFKLAKWRPCLIGWTFSLLSSQLLVSWSIFQPFKIFRRTCALWNNVCMSNPMQDLSLCSPTGSVQRSVIEITKLNETILMSLFSGRDFLKFDLQNDKKISVNILIWKLFDHM